MVDEGAGEGGRKGNQNLERKGSIRNEGGVEGRGRQRLLVSHLEVKSFQKTWVQMPQMVYGKPLKVFS